MEGTAYTTYGTRDAVHDDEILDVKCDGCGYHCSTSEVIDTKCAESQRLKYTPGQVYFSIHSNDPQGPKPFMNSIGTGGFNDGLIQLRKTGGEKSFKVGTTLFHFKEMVLPTTLIVLPNHNKFIISLFQQEEMPF